MQVTAIAEAGVAVKGEGVDVLPEIMIPLVARETELKELRQVTERAFQRVAEQHRDLELVPLIGTMIEVPRAALTADVIAEYADVFSFGTNDLTLMTYGLSRDAVTSFSPDYIEAGIFPCDPFVSIDQDGVGQLVKIGVSKGRATKPALKIGICGEHGGDPASVKFCVENGLDYVSCSPYRVPVARLAAAHAAVEAKLMQTD